MKRNYQAQGRGENHRNTHRTESNQAIQNATTGAFAREIEEGETAPHRTSSVTATSRPSATHGLAEFGTSTGNITTLQYGGMDFRNYQTARPVQPPTQVVPLHRQLATIQNADQARLIRSLNLCRETHRFQIFNSDWPLDSAPSGREMSASGWFYLGNLDRTQCFCCGGVLRNWRRLDNPTTEHISHFPHCAMAQGREIRNIPDTERQGAATSTIGQNELTAQQRSDLRTMFPCEFPVTPSMRLIGDRVNTFNNWYFTRATPQMMAEAGFFSLEVRDRVKCFYCNGGLQNWRQDDNPWEEHAKWYPTCEFLLQRRGPQYIHTIVARFPNINRPILHAPGQNVPPAQLTSIAPGNLTLPSPLTGGEAQGVPHAQSQAQSALDVAMQSEVAATVVGMDFDEMLVRDVMRTYHEQEGTFYETATALYDAVVEAQNAREAEESATPEVSLDISPSVFSLDEERMDDDLYEDLYSSNVGTGSVSASTSAAESSFANVDLNRPNTSTAIRNGDQTTQRSHHLPESTEDSKKLSERLRKKLQELKEERLCKVCLDRRADVVFIPCGHICCCMECTRALRICPICRVKLEKAVRTYTS